MVGGSYPAGGRRPSRRLLQAHRRSAQPRHPRRPRARRILSRNRPGRRHRHARGHERGVARRDAIRLPDLHRGCQHGRPEGLPRHRAIPARLGLPRPPECAAIATLPGKNQPVTAKYRWAPLRRSVYGWRCVRAPAASRLIRANPTVCRRHRQACAQAGLDLRRAVKVTQDEPVSTCDRVRSCRTPGGIGAAPSCR